MTGPSAPMVSMPRSPGERESVMGTVRGLVGPKGVRGTSAGVCHVCCMFWCVCRRIAC